MAHGLVKTESSSNFGATPKEAEMMVYKRPKGRAKMPLHYQKALVEAIVICNFFFKNCKNSI